MLPRRLAALALSALLAGCAGFPVSSGMPEQQVRARAGAPDAVWKNADGSEVWEYPLGPLGTETYLVTLGPDRTVREVRQVLNEETISRLRAGMSRDEVRRLIGRPRDVGFSGRNDEEIWSWRYREWNVRDMELYVQFDRPTGRLKRFSRFQVDTSESKPR
jgi:hypothetical protein